jgi:uracil-DNA glycosylase family 4
MSFAGLNLQKVNKVRTPIQYSAELTAKGCAVCPLKSVEPKLEPTGSPDPVIYIIGEAPGEEEARQGVQFIGLSGQLLRQRIPQDWLPFIRWNNCIRSRPPGNRDPDPVELACCRPSIVEDIERSKPRAIFGFGNVPLNWALGVTGITDWNGRRAPVKIGNHTCWYYAFLHPAGILRENSDRTIHPGTDYHSDKEFAFAFALQRAFEEVEHLPDPIVDNEAVAKEGVVVLRKPSEIISVIGRAWKQTSVGLDYETNGLRPMAEGAKILSIGMSYRQAHYSWPMHHKDAGYTKNDLSCIEEAFEEWLHNSKCRKIAHNAAFEQEWSGHFYGYDCINDTWEDTQSQAFVLDVRQGVMSLDLLCNLYFGIKVKSLSNLDRKRMEDYSLDEILPYNAIDAKYCNMLFTEQTAELFKQGLGEVYKQHMRRVSALTLTQLKGVPISQKANASLLAKYEGRIKQLDAQLAADPDIIKYNKIKPKTFRPTSPADTVFLFNKVIGGYGLSNADVEALNGVDHPLVEPIIQHRKASKVVSTYLKPFTTGAPTMYPDGKAHPSYPTTRVITSRTSAADPNIQNQNKRDLESKEVRSQVVAPLGDIIVSVDYASIQARNVAWESKDPSLVQAFIDHYDIHQDWMERLVKLYPSWIKEGVRALSDKKLKGSYRHKAKNKFVFPSFFGAAPSSIASHGYLNIPINTAYDLQNQLWSKFAGIKRWQDRIRNDFYLNGYVTGLSGYRRPAPTAYTEIVNSPIQADEAKIVMEALARLSERHIWDLQPILEVHDDITFCFSKKKLDYYLPTILQDMLLVEYDWIITPVAVEVSIGPNWHELEEIGKFESTSDGGYREYK